MQHAECFTEFFPTGHAAVRLRVSSMAVPLKLAGSSRRNGRNGVESFAGTDNLSGLRGADDASAKVL